MTATATAPAPTWRGLAGAFAWLTTPLLPEDYLSLVNPLWSARDPATIVIRPGRNWSTHRAGQYVRLGVEINGVRHWRTYSLTSAPGRAGGRISITVKATPDGLVSNTWCITQGLGRSFTSPDPT